MIQRVVVPEDFVNHLFIFIMYFFLYDKIKLVLFTQQCSEKKSAWGVGGELFEDRRVYHRS